MIEYSPQEQKDAEIAVDKLSWGLAGSRASSLTRHITAPDDTFEARSYGGM